MIFGLKVRCWIDGCIKLSVNFRELKSYSKQNITDSDIKNVVDVLRSESLSRGPKIKEFEEKRAMESPWIFKIGNKNEK